VQSPASNNDILLTNDHSRFSIRLKSGHLLTGRSEKGMKCGGGEKEGGEKGERGEGSEKGSGKGWRI
jgi:hypothetical protein